MQSLGKQKSVIQLALKVAQVLNAHPNRSEADVACVIARALLSLDTFQRGVVLGGANKGLQKSASA
jgi:hypothetical protein